MQTFINVINILFLFLFWHKWKLLHCRKGPDQARPQTELRSPSPGNVINIQQIKRLECSLGWASLFFSSLAQALYTQVLYLAVPTRTNYKKRAGIFDPSKRGTWWAGTIFFRTWECHLTRVCCCSHQCFFYWRNFAKRRFFFTSSLFMAKFEPKKNILVAKNSSILTIRHPFEPIFIRFQGFHPTSGWIGFRICFSGAT
jgi:hypothetical protein